MGQRTHLTRGLPAWAELAARPARGEFEMQFLIRRAFAPLAGLPSRRFLRSRRLLPILESRSPQGGLPTAVADARTRLRARQAARCASPVRSSGRAAHRIAAGW